MKKLLEELNSRTEILERDCTLRNVQIVSLMEAIDMKKVLDFACLFATLLSTFIKKTINAALTLAELVSVDRDLIG